MPGNGNMDVLLVYDGFCTPLAEWMVNMGILVFVPNPAIGGYRQSFLWAKT